MAQFNTNVFINCPFDKDYEPILQAILFCLIYLGLDPKIATERTNSAEARLAKIAELIETSRFSIHDLSRCQAAKEGELYRLNMPFELGIDWACRKYKTGKEGKSILVLEREKFRYQAAISDLAGCDIESHEDHYDIAIRKVRNWIYSETKSPCDGATRIIEAYADFHAWYYERQLANGFSDADIKDYPTSELLEAMRDWFTQGKPIASSAH
jgi:hypothetical protein